MKTAWKIRLVLSHLALIAIGWAIGSGLEPAPETADSMPSVRETRPPRATNPAEPNPILRARSADFAAAWDEMLRGDRSENGELRGNSISFFIVWCSVDPEGAVFGLSKLYAPRFGHNYLNNAIDPHGAELAPALVEHWRKLTLQQSYKVTSCIGRALRKLADENPAQTADLMTQLPPGIRSEIYDDLFENLDRPKLESIIASMPRSEDLDEQERSAQWQAFAKSLERSDPESGVTDWLTKADDPQARRALVEVAVLKSIRNENWDDFLTTLETFGPTKQSAIIEDALIVSNPYQHQGENRARLLQSCEARGLDAIAEQIRSQPKD